MEVAEREIRRAFPSGGEPAGLFLALRPRPSPRMPPLAYASHARELCNRAKDGGDLRAATDAECLCALSEMSLRAPLRSTAAALYESLFVRVTNRTVPGVAAREQWPGAAGELHQSLRARLRDPARVP